MVQPMENFSQGKFVNCSTIMVTSDKQQPISAKKLALREIPNVTKNTILKNPVSDSVKVLGFKRQQPSCPANEKNGHLVYVRRKFENSPGKITININNCMNEPKLQSPPSYSIAKPINGMSISSSNCSGVPNGISDDNEPERVPNAVHVHPETPAIPAGTRELWRERFFRLQMFLKSCDESNQEEYIQRLRSLSAAERSRHAYELEKRAIQLTLEEGKELHRMRILNIMGNAAPIRNTSPIAQNRSFTTVVQEE